MYEILIRNLTPRLTGDQIGPRLPLHHHPTLLLNGKLWRPPLLHQIFAKLFDLLYKALRVLEVVRGDVIAMHESVVLLDISDVKL